MKRILFIVALLVATQGVAQSTEAQATSDLMGLGMPGKLAEAVADLVTGGGVVGNDVYIKARNAANSANIDVLKVDSGDDTTLNADTGDVIKLAVAGTSIAEITSEGILPALDGDNATSNLGSALKGFKNLFLTDATRDASLLVSNGLYINYPTGQGLFFREGSTTKWTMTATSGDLAATASGATIAIQEATAGSACSGTLTANGATPVVTSTTCATTGSRIFLQRTSAETGAVNAWVSAISNGVSFSVTGEAADTGTYNWIIFHEAA